jgi:putative transcriptional regulator
MMQKRSEEELELAEKIAGEITLSEHPGKTIRKWREEFHISQVKLAELLGLSPSVISDYESGRRKSPGVSTVRRIVEALFTADAERGYPVLSHYNYKNAEHGRGRRSSSGVGSSNGVIDIREFSVGIPMSVFVDAINGEVLSDSGKPGGYIHGYTVLDSLKAIVKFTALDYLKVYGWSSERALIFTKVTTGRSPMVAIRAHPLKPAMVVYHRPQRVDPLALKLAEVERVQLVRTNIPLKRLLAALNNIREE